MSEDQDVDNQLLEFNVLSRRADAATTPDDRAAVRTALTALLQRAKDVGVAGAIRTKLQALGS